MKIRFVTSNEHKFLEVKRMLSKVAEVIWVKMEYPEVQSSSLEEVASFSARWLEDKVEKPFFLEDSGLFIEALNGFPGPFSSYVFKTIGNNGILKLMEGISNRKATFKSVIALMEQDLHLFIGSVQGSIAEEVRGGGWGFDPIFIPDGSNGLTFGELGERKDEFSHRGRSVTKLLNYLSGRNS